MKVVEGNFTLLPLASPSCQHTGHFFLKDKVNTRYSHFFFSSFQLCSHTEEANNSCSKQKRERRAFTRQILNIMDGMSLKDREKEENFRCSSAVLKSKKCPKNRATAAALFETAVSGNASSLCLAVYPKPFSLFTAFSTCGGKKNKKRSINFCLISASDVGIVTQAVEASRAAQLLRAVALVQVGERSSLCSRSDRPLLRFPAPLFNLHIYNTRKTSRVKPKLRRTNCPGARLPTAQPAGGSGGGRSYLCRCCRAATPQL